MQLNDQQRIRSPIGLVNNYRKAVKLGYIIVRSKAQLNA